MPVAGCGQPLAKIKIYMISGEYLLVNTETIVLETWIGCPLLTHFKPLKLFYPIPYMAAKEKFKTSISGDHFFKKRLQTTFEKFKLEPLGNGAFWVGAKCAIVQFIRTC
ncbi:MAG: hypothetical protein ACYCXO_04765 [Candidatus Humimicrobiaceae bacterium]